MKSKLVKIITILLLVIENFGLTPSNAHADQDLIPPHQKIMEVINGKGCLSFPIIIDADNFYDIEWHVEFQNRAQASLINKELEAPDDIAHKDFKNSAVSYVLSISGNKIRAKRYEGITYRIDETMWSKDGSGYKGRVLKGIELNQGRFEIDVCIKGVPSALENLKSVISIKHNLH